MSLVGRQRLAEGWWRRPPPKLFRAVQVAMPAEPAPFNTLAPPRTAAGFAQGSNGDAWPPVAEPSRGSLP